MDCNIKDINQSLQKNKVFGNDSSEDNKKFENDRRSRIFSIIIIISLNILLLCTSIQKSLILSPTKDELVSIGSGLIWLESSNDFPIIRLPGIDILSAIVIKHSKEYAIFSSNISIDKEQDYIRYYNIVGHNNLLNTFYQIGHNIIFSQELSSQVSHQLPNQSLMLIARLPTILGLLFSPILLLCILNKNSLLKFCKKNSNILKILIVATFQIVLILSYQPLISSSTWLLALLLLVWIIFPQWLNFQSNSSNKNITLDIILSTSIALIFIFSGILGFILVMALFSSVILINDINNRRISSGYNFYIIISVFRILIITFFVMWGGYKFTLTEPLNVPLVADFIFSDQKIIPFAEPWRMLLNSVLLEGSEGLICYLGDNMMECSSPIMRALSNICQIHQSIIFIFIFCCFIMFIAFLQCFCQKFKQKKYELYYEYNSKNLLLLIIVPLVLYIVTILYRNDQEYSVYETLKAIMYLMISIYSAILLYSCFLCITLYLHSLKKVNDFINRLILNFSKYNKYIILAFASVFLIYIASFFPKNSTNIDYINPIFSVNKLVSAFNIWHDDFDRGQYGLLLKEQVKNDLHISIQNSKGFSGKYSEYNEFLEKNQQLKILYYNDSTINTKFLFFDISKSRNEIITHSSLCKSVVNTSLEFYLNKPEFIKTNINNANIKQIYISKSNIFSFICKNNNKEYINSIAKNPIVAYDFLNLYQVEIYDYS